MPLPSPLKDESKDSFIQRFMSDEVSIKEFPEDKQRLESAHKSWSEKKELRFCDGSVMEFKESDSGLIVKGYIATTHYDGQDKILLDTLRKWEKEINEGNPRANKVSINHNRIPHVAGVGLKGSARVERLPDGEFGLYVETLVDRTREDFPDIKYRVENNLLDSFSIEYIAPESAKYENDTRILDDRTELYGWTLASQPMNEHAIMIKEIIGKKEGVEDILCESPIEKEEDKNMSEEQAKEEQIVISKEEKELLSKVVEEKEEKAFEEKIMKVLKSESFQSELSKIEVDRQPLQNKEEDKGDEEVEENIEGKQMAKEYVSILQSKELDIESKFKRVGLLAEKKGLLWAEGDRVEYKKASEKVSFKNFTTNGNKLEFKALGLTTNQNSDTDYLLSSAELRDMFDPVIYDALNNSSSVWALLKKDDFSSKGNNQVQFVLRIGANSTASFYTGNAVATGQSSLLKMQTKFKKVQVGVSVDGDMIAASRGSQIGDVFGQHVMWATDDMLEVVDTALFAEAGLETSASPIGFEYICDSAGNTTMYNLTRSTTNKLAPDSAGDTYINGASARVSLANLRSAIKQAEMEGAKRQNLVFITHPTQEMLFKGLYDSSQLHAMSMNPRFGFEGMMHFDGIPIFASKNCNTDDWYLVDLESHRVAIWMPPTLEMLGKRADAEEGFIKMYFATYNTAPRRMVMIYGNATS